MSQSNRIATGRLYTDPVFTAHRTAQHEFRTLANVFARNPSATNFLKLEAAAMLLQGAQGRLDERCHEANSSNKGNPMTPTQIQQDFEQLRQQRHQQFRQDMAVAGSRSGTAHCSTQITSNCIKAQS